MPKALDVIEQELEGPNAYKIAIEILRVAGVDRTGRSGGIISAMEIGPTDPDEIIEAEVRQVRRTEAKAIFMDVTGEGPVSERERLVALSRLEARRKALGGE